jgi:hypothetical protein
MSQTNVCKESARDPRLGSAGVPPADFRRGEGQQRPARRRRYKNRALNSGRTKSEALLSITSLLLAREDVRFL